MRSPLFFVKTLVLTFTLESGVFALGLILSSSLFVQDNVAQATSAWSCIRQLTERRQVPSLDELEFVSDQHMEPLLHQMAPPIRAKFERLIRIQQRSAWKTPEQPLAALLSAHLMVDSGRNLSEIQVPVLLLQETTLWIQAVARRRPHNVQALMLQSYANDILNAASTGAGATVRYGAFIDLTVRAIWFLDHPNRAFTPIHTPYDQVLINGLLHPANPFLIPIPTHRKLWLRDWIGLAAPEQIAPPSFFVGSAQDFYAHDQSHTRQMQYGALFMPLRHARISESWNDRRDWSTWPNPKSLSPEVVEILLNGAIQDFAARSLLVASVESVATLSGRDAVESYLFNRFHERGTLVPTLDELRSDGSFSSPAEWRSFLNGFVIVQAGWGLRDRIRLDRASVREEFHAWYLAHYLPFVEQYLTAHSADYSEFNINEMRRLIAGVRAGARDQLTGGQ